VPLASLDRAHRGLRIAHLTDIHVGLLTPTARIRRAVELVRDLRPHLVLLTGDFVGYGTRFVDRMSDLLAGLPGEVACVLGNHDHWTAPYLIARTLERLGYRVLRNQHATVEIGGAPVHLVGIDDAITGHHDLARAFRSVPQSGGTTIALTHAPNLADAAVARGA